MIFFHNQSKSAFAFVSVFLGLLCSCTNQQSNPREELLRSLKGANVEGYFFATGEEDRRLVSSLTNGAVRNLIKLDGIANLTLRYTSVKEKNANTAKTYKTEIIRAGDTLTLLITDIATGEIVSKEAFPAPEPHKNHGTGGNPPTFDTLEACLNDFNCTRKGAAQCEANRTCRNQLIALTCCLNNGQCFSVHLIIKPTAFKCQLRDLVPDLEGLVLSR